MAGGTGGLGAGVGAEPEGAERAGAVAGLAAAGARGRALTKAGNASGANQL